ncbi:MAG: patatin-like phospholipase family protein [Legionellaceae bacterium]|nr:patatin-like phospholipase family protein [Legionellaceae bacterium]
MFNTPPKITKKQIVSFLSTIDLFSHLSRHDLAEIGKGFTVTSLAGNTVLFQQNDPADSLYILMYGFLRALKKDASGQERVIGEISAGNVVGEIGCLCDEPRTASIYAIRDSILLKLTPEAFDDLVGRHPAVMMGIATQSIKRLVNPNKYSPKRDTSCFTVMPAGNYLGVEKVVQIFTEKLAKYGDTLLLTYSKFKRMLSDGEKKIPIDSTEMLSFFQEIESKYRFIVYLAKENDVWAKRCIRQADKILLVGKYGNNPDISELEATLFDGTSQISPTIELVLLADDKHKKLVNVKKWLKPRNLSQHYNIRLSSHSDIERLVRLITGNALGLVLSGGGPPALANVGVIRALEEENISIDYIGGTSMGSLIAGLFALEHDSQSIEEILTHQLTAFQKNLDYTLPLIAMVRAKTLDRLLRSSFGRKTEIENLWHKFFCVSTNISTNKLCVHEEGLLWKGIRASLSLPGILPAVLGDERQMYVDGGILNNLPVDVMSSRINEGKILTGSIKPTQESPSSLSYREYTSSGWYLLFKYFILPKLSRHHPKKRISLINISSIIQKSMIVASENHQHEMLLRADYNVTMDLSNFGMINFLPIKEIIESGYRQAVPILENMDLSRYKS